VEELKTKDKVLYFEHKILKIKSIFYCTFLSKRYTYSHSVNILVKLKLFLKKALVVILITG